MALLPVRHDAIKRVAALLLVLGPLGVAGCGADHAEKQPAAAVRAGSAAPATTTAATVSRLRAIEADVADWPAVIQGAGAAWQPAVGGRARALRADVDELLAGSRPRTARASADVRRSLHGLRGLLTLAGRPTVTLPVARLLADEIGADAGQLAGQLQRGQAPPGRTGPAAALAAVDRALFRARVALASGDPGAAVAAVGRASRAARPAATSLSALPHAAGRMAALLGAARRAAARGDQMALARARGSVQGVLRVAAYRLELKAIGAHAATTAAGWAAARDFGPAAGARTVRDDSTQALRRLADGGLAPGRAQLSVQREGMDLFQRRAISLVQQAALSGYRADDAGRAQDAALAASYWDLIAPVAASRLGEPAAAAAGDALRHIAGLGAGAAPSALDGSVATATQALGAFTAAPLTATERAAKIESLIRLAMFESSQLCGAPSSVPTDPAEASAVAPTLSQTANDLAPHVAPSLRIRLRRGVDSLLALPRAAGVGGEDVPASRAMPSAAARKLCRTADADLRAVFPQQWRAIGMTGDIDQVERLLTAMEREVAAGHYPAAEAARRRAYAAFEFGAELRLRAFDPGLAARIEGLFWAGAPGGPDLVTLISRRSPADAVRARSGDLRSQLEHARVVLQTAQSSAAAVLNSTIVVFREGLEAALILAALAASFATGGARWRRPLIGGMLAAIPATLLTWVLTDAVLDSFSSYGLQLEAILDAAALAVLAIIMAWFFQRFCWTRFVARTHARRSRFAVPGLGGHGADVALAIFGFTVLYREGFETVLYLAALKLRAGGTSVLEGVIIGILATLGLAVLMLRLRRRLPYRGIVVVTAVAIGALLVIMAGQAARAFEAVGWLSIHPVDAPIPVWAGQWLGLYPAAETLVAQLVALAAIPAASEAIRRHRNRRQARRIAVLQARRALRTDARPRGAEALGRSPDPTRAPL